MKTQKYRNLTPRHIKQQRLLATIILKTFLLEIVRIYITLVTSLLIGSRFSLSCLKNSIPSSQPPVTYLGTRHITFLSFHCTRHIQTIDNKTNPTADLKDNECSFPPKANNGTGNWDIKDCTSVSVRQKLDQNLT